ncbi:MAG TPA: hypothetical protein VEK15_21150 [Vicinamibacteria bacterium]|nr:hypothetical protein [Vicinamibacteria bacterium]
MDNVVYRAWTKGIRDGAHKPRYGMEWLSARRGWFKVFDDRIECGNWSIPYSSIQEAVLFKSRQVLIPVSVLRLATPESTYQFGFNPWVQVEGHLPFQVRNEEIGLKYSAFFFALRIAVLGSVVFLIWRTFFGGAI